MGDYKSHNSSTELNMSSIINVLINNEDEGVIRGEPNPLLPITPFPPSQVCEVDVTELGRGEEVFILFSSRFLFKGLFIHLFIHYNFVL